MVFQRHIDKSSFNAIPIKANKLLQLILILLIVIGIKLWHLSVIQHDTRLDSALKARKKVVVEPADRGTIRDRYNILLAHNKIAYRVNLIYNQMLQIPQVAFETDASGAKKKRYPRREYIQNLSSKLAAVLQLDPLRIEDEIHSNAVFYGHTPYLIKDQISESEYYKLRMMEKDWPGLSCQRYPKRHYPCGKVGSHVIGYLGPMPKARYDAILTEIKELELYIKQLEDRVLEDPVIPQGISSYGHAKRRLSELQDLAYSISDHVGLLGVEQAFEEDLRGYSGKKIYFSDARGNFLRPLSGSHRSIPGKRLYLTVSKELQEFSEQLLCQSEEDREVLTQRRQKTPWVRGGAIVAMEPNTGELLAFASFPRFDPNDFSSTKSRANSTLWWENPTLQWLENESAFAALWDGLMPLSKEEYSEKSGEFSEEKKPLSWDLYLKWLLPDDSAIKSLIHENIQLKSLIDVQKAFSSIMAIAPTYSASDIVSFLYPSQQNKGKQHLMEKDALQFFQDISEQKKILDKSLRSLDDNRDKLLFLDLCRLVLNADFVADEIGKTINQLTIAQFKGMTRAYITVLEEVRQEVRKIFRSHDFAQFRRDNEKQFLKNKRLEERTKKKAPRPYLEHIDREEKEQFERFWGKWKRFFMEYTVLKKSSLPDSKQESLTPYFQALEGAIDAGALDEKMSKLEVESRIPFMGIFRSFFDLKEPLYGSYANCKVLKDLARAFSPSLGPGHLTSLAYRNPTAQGSIFKIVTAYAALCQKYREDGEHADFRLFEMIDRVFQQGGKTYVGTFMDGQLIPQLYKGGRIPKSLTKNIGKVDLARAIETSSDPYFSLLAAEYLKDPDDLISAAKHFGYGDVTGIKLPHEAKGSLPSDLKTNKTGLYAFAIGQGAFTATPIQSAVMISGIANGGRLLQPKIDKMLVGRGCFYDKELKLNKEYPLKKALHAVGLDFQLFLAKLPPQEKPTLQMSEPVIRETLFLPERIRQELLYGMKRVVARLQRDGRRQFTAMFAKHPKMGKDFQKTGQDIVGKTSTAEFKERLSPFESPEIRNHIWFGGTAFDNRKQYVFHDAFGKPELVVVVYLRYGGYGKETAPLAICVAKKWRDIKERHGE